MVASNLLDLVGNTPLVQLSRLDTGPCALFAKLESQNPGGSIKDRIAVSMIDAAERQGALRPGGTIVEATAGNTGLALALVGSLKGYKTLLVVPDKMSREKIQHLKALGAEVVMTRSDVGKGHPAYYQDLAERLASERASAWYANQFANPANPAAHERTTGPEIWAQMNERVDAIVCGVGSGGTITGLTHFFRGLKQPVKMILADPQGSVLAEYTRSGVIGTAGSWQVEGIGEDFLPPIVDLSGVSQAYSIDDKESFAAARELFRVEGVFAGSSSGTLLAAALRYCRSRTSPERVVTFVCDTGAKYLSKMYDDFWLADQGLLDRATAGDLTDLITRRFAEGAVVTTAPTDTLLAAHGLFKLYNVSQLPVVEEGRIVGLVDESDVLLAVVRDAERFAAPVSSVMSTRLDTVSPDAPIARLLNIFEREHVPILVADGEFVGLITRIDILNYLRRKLV
ncbi:MAG TPA: pyridoxal-phosphate dependent enzyme [Casimicrobiaceae bacterium]|nr:pyridoxal-phosphate dependent enzyme [Casimicrobiaceae bacterium]